jgi:hypothetical protein
VKTAQKVVFFNFHSRALYVAEVVDIPDQDSHLQLGLSFATMCCVTRSVKK